MADGAAPQYDVLGIGNAIVDVIARAEDEFLGTEALTKGAMTLIDASRAEQLYDRMGPGREISGGSAANTLACLASIGRKCAFIGQVADDELGKVFSHDIRAGGIDYAIPPRAADVPTARCLILVTPDGQRTMNTYLGATQYLPESAIDDALIADSRILYLEGYLWDPEEPRKAMKRAIAAARSADRKIAFTLSDTFVIERYRADFDALIEAGEIDILFANEDEICAMAQTDDLESAIAALAPRLPILVVTRGEQGASCIEDGERCDVFAEDVARVVDTTGAGDAFAAGFLAAHVAGKDNRTALRMGAIAAAEIISHYGARPETPLAELIGEKLG